MLFLIVVILCVCLTILSWILYLTDRLIKMDVNTEMAEGFISHFIADYVAEHPEKKEFLLGWLYDKEKDA